MIKKRKFIFYIDGDNVQVPKDVELLHENDEIHIFYNSGNKSFTSAKKEEIAVCAKCSVDYHVITASANAVDFAIAIEVCKRYAENKDEQNMYILVSKDNHFETIARELNRSFTLKKGFYRVNSIKEALSKYFLFKVENEEGLRQVLVENFGNVRGTAIFKTISDIFVKRKPGSLFLKKLRHLSIIK